jgi:hypothetical protein
LPSSVRIHKTDEKERKRKRERERVSEERWRETVLNSVLEDAGGGGGAERDMEALNETSISRNNYPL